MFRNLKSVVLALLAVALMFGCQGPPRPGYHPREARTSTVSEDAKVIYLNSKATFNKNIDPMVIECGSQYQIGKKIKIYASKHNVNVVLNGKPKASDTVLKIHVDDAGTHDGVNKFVAITGKLYEGKKLKASFKAARRSSRGGRRYGPPGFSGNGMCSGLSHSVQTLGDDTAKWIVNPVDGARLGDVDYIK